jgi:hypothetical protein
MTEDLMTLVTVRTYEIAHILNESEDRNVHLFEHGVSLARVGERDVLRG